MENKYYTPEMSEFHVGFEYELLLPDSNYHKRIFGKDKVAHPQLEEHSDELMKIAHAIVRVKCLDREDIESLGWKLISSRGENQLKESMLFEIPYKDPREIDDKMQLYWSGINTHILIAQGHDETSYHEWAVRFSGNIKNRSELKLIMKWLSI